MNLIKALLLSFFLSISAIAQTADQVVANARARAELLKTRTPRLFVVNLPAGDTGSINIDWFNNGATRRNSQDWLSQGYEGIVFKGQGVDSTHIRATSWDGISVAVGRHNGIVRFENLTIHSGSDRATAFGQQNLGKDNFPGFQIELVNVKGLVDRPFYFFTRDGKFRIVAAGSGYAVGNELTAVGGVGTPAKFKVTTVGANGSVTGLQVLTRGSYTSAPPYEHGGLQTVNNGSGSGCKLELGARPKWLWFGYNADVFMQNVFSNAKQAVEHAAYWHGFAQYGAYVVNSTFFSSGAEGFKVRSDATETRWAGPNQAIYIADTNFRDYFQCWSWRGGAGIVLQGSNSHVVLERLHFFGGGDLNCGGFYPNVQSNMRSLAVAVSAEGNSYDQATGQVGVGYGNGHVWLDKIAAYGMSAVDWRNNLIYVARNGGTQKSARSVTIDHSSLWGQKMFVNVNSIDPGTGVLRNSNTIALEEYAQSVGMDTSFEAVVPRSTLVPVSVGATW